jgi:hypothetical protein
MNTSWRHQRILCPKWEWADLDGKTLVWAEAGFLFRAPISSDGLGPSRMLHDFNDMKFEARAAPY